MRGLSSRLSWAALLWVVPALACGDGDATDSPATAASALQVSPDDFIGADACAQCHQGEYEAWAGSTHGRAGGEPNAETIIVPFDGQPITFRDGSVVPRVNEAGEYEFLVRQDGFDELRYSVDGVVGGGHMLGGGTQGFVSRFPDGTVRFLPYDYSRQEDAWFCNTGSRLDDGWVIIRSDMAMADCGDVPPVRVLGTIARFANCQSCHGSQIQADLEPGRGVETAWETLAVNCETCHGPARGHVDWAGSGAGGEDIGLESRVVDNLDRSLEVCFQCHALKDVVAEDYLTGESFEDHYALKLPILGDDPYLADGRVRTFAYQGTHLSSSCYIDGAMSCVSCHEPHGQGYWDVNRMPLASEVDDGQCTSCHGAKLQDPEAHTGHPPSAEVTCVACHMPYLQHPEVGDEIAFARSDHTIPVPRPALDARLGLVSACRGCHEDRSEIRLQAETEAIWGELKPHDPLVRGLLNVTQAMAADQAGELLIRPELDRPMTQFQALARYATGWARVGEAPDPATAEGLRRLAASSDMDLKALALATQHLGSSDGTVEGAALEEHPPALRRRWGMILGYLGDSAAGEGDAAGAEAIYRRALAVLPEDASLFRSLGLLHNQTGEFGRAVDAFNRSLASDPDQALTHVNLGVAHAGLGDAAAALRSYEAALRIDPNEALAHFNTGNVHLRAGSLDQAIAAYRRAVELDPGLGLGHYNLGIALIRAQRYQEALPHARRAVEFSPENEQARQMLSDLQRAVGGP